MAYHFMSKLAFLASLCLIGSTATNEMAAAEEIKSADYFTSDWRNTFTNAELSLQPKWALDEKQPSDGGYEVRNYTAAWWVTSFTPCMDQDTTTSYGYLRLYLYMNTYNSRYQQFNLTYPILNGVSKDIDYSSRFRCPKYFTRFYLPDESLDGYNEPPRGTDDFVSAFKSDSQIRYVLSYQDQLTDESTKNCNEQAENFAVRLTADGLDINENSYSCAMYESERYGVRFEVWFTALVGGSET